MMTRSPSPRTIGGLLVLALMASAIPTSDAQQPPLRPGQTPGPRFVMSALKGEGDGPRLGFQVANAVRERIASDFDMRALWVVPESTITAYLVSAGYPADQPLSRQETVQLAQSFRAEEVLNGVVTKTASGGYRVQAAWSLAPREDMVQPLPAVEAAKISDVAKLVAREFQAARKQVESVQRCISLARARNYAGALSEARKAIDTYPKSVLGRVCIANIYDLEKLGPDSMIRISEEILTIHPENGRALAFAADAYSAKRMIDDQIRMLKRLVALEPTNLRVRLALATAYANSGEADSARPIVDTAVVQDPFNVEAVSLQWRVHLATQNWVGALASGARMVSLDTSLATRTYFVRMIATAEAAGRPDMASNFAMGGAAKFPADDELGVLEVQYLRRAGKLREALNDVTVITDRNRRAPNAWTQKALIEMELRLSPDTVLATLARALENGDDRATVARYATSIGQAAARDTTAPNKLDPLRRAIRYYKFAESAQAGDTTSFLIGSASVILGQRLATEPAAAKTCDIAKELQSVLVDAQIELPKAGRSFPTEVPRYMAVAAQLGPYADQLAKSVCR